MEEHSCVKINPSTKIQIAVRASSEGRHWTGFDAHVSDLSHGLSALPGRAFHTVIMHLGPPVDTASRCDGIVQRRHCGPGDLDIVPIGHPARWERNGPTTMLGIHVMPSLIASVASDMGLDLDRISVAPQLQIRDPRIEHICWALRAELVVPTPHGRLYADSLGLALAARLLQPYAPAIAPRPGRGLSKRQLAAVTDYIHDNLAGDLSLHELAAVAGLSASHFKTLFKESTNSAVHQYVVFQRVEFAVSLLAKNGCSLSEVAALAGFSDQSHMARCMRRVIGTTPMTVRRHHTSAADLPPSC